MPNEEAGVGGVPAANQGVAGSQDSGGTPPGPSEGKAPVQTKSAPAPSGFGDVSAQGEEPRVPYPRFEELGRKLEEAKQREVELRRQLDQASSPPPVASTPALGADTGGHLDLQIQQVQSALSRAKEDGDTVGETSALTKLIRLQAQAQSVDLFEGYLKSQAQAQEKRDYDSIREQSVREMYTRFPGLKDQQSEFFKNVDTLWKTDVWLSRSPTGELDAACRVASRLAGSEVGGASEANALRDKLGIGGASHTDPTEVEKRESALGKAMDGLQGGNHEALKNFIMEHHVKGQTK